MAAGTELVEMMFVYIGRLQEIRNSGASGYKYITVDEDDAASVIYANNTLVHLSVEQIPKGSAVCVTCHLATVCFLHHFFTVKPQSLFRKVH